MSTALLLLALPQCIWSMFRSTQDPLVHHGRHFGRAVHSFCSMQTLLTNGILSMAEDPDVELLSAVCVCKFSVFRWSLTYTF